MANEKNAGILNGVRVLDLTRMLSGPYCTMMLSDHGAEVIKIESEAGDSSRANGPFREDDPKLEWAGYFVSLNRSKKSIKLDLKTEHGKENFKELVKHADVLVENFRPEVMERLGLQYEELTKINPKLVYGAIRGFGDPRSGESPYATWPSYDVVAQAMGGVIGITGADPNSPTKVGPGVGDIFTGMMMSFGVIAALRHAEATGHGQFIDISMYDAVLSLCERAVYQYDIDGTIPRPEGNGHPLLAPFGIFPAKNGQVAIGIVDDTFWIKLANSMEREPLAYDERFSTRAARKQNSKLVNEIVANWTKQRTKNELSDILGGEIPFGPVNTIEDIFKDKHINIRKMISTIPHKDKNKRDWKVAANPIKFSLSPAPKASTPPKIGEHNEKYLFKENSLDRNATLDDIRSLRNAFGNFATGVTVVTTIDDDSSPRGFTANSFTSVSLEPPLLLVCIAKTAYSAPVFSKSKYFAINILSEKQKDLSGLFSSQEKNKFAHSNWFIGTKNLPILKGNIAQFVCENDKLIDGGDHLILIGKVVEHKVTEGTPLGYFKGNYFSVSHEQTLVEAANETGSIMIGGVLSKANKILLKVKNKNISVPKSPQNMISKNGFLKYLEDLRLKPQLNFIYAIYRDSESSNHHIFYNGTVEGDPPNGFKYFDLNKIPFDKIALPAEKSMLERYAKEFKHGTFGFYEGSEQAGIVREMSSIPSKYEIKDP